MFNKGERPYIEMNIVWVTDATILLYELETGLKLIQLITCLQKGVLNNNSNVFRHSVTIESTSNNDIYALFNRLEFFLRSTKFGFVVWYHTVGDFK